MRPYRLATYLHSDGLTPNKGCSVIRLSSDTDFCLRDLEVIDYANNLAMLVYATQTPSWYHICQEYPEVQEKLENLRTRMKENLVVEEIAVFLEDGGSLCTPDDPVSLKRRDPSITVWKRKEEKNDQK